MTMSRELDVRESVGDERSAPLQGGEDTLRRADGVAANDRADQVWDRVPDPADRLRPGRDRNSALSVRAEQTVADIGAFRAVRFDDLARYRYGGDQAATARDLRRLGQLGLVNRHRMSVTGGRMIDVAVLTEAGRARAERQPSPAGEARQIFHAGLVKPRELAHDVAIYRMFQAERARLTREGARVRRVLLDYELKQRIFSSPGRGSERAGREEQAAAHGLRTVNGKVAIPDLRIEYETAAGDAGRVDLELTTEHYKAAQLRAKLDAGFQLYVAGPPSARMNAVLEERGVTASILEL
jgi:hypothetical protein